VARGIRRVAADARPDWNSETVFRGVVGRFNCMRANRRKSGSVFFPPSEIDNWCRISCGEKASLPIRSIEQLIDKSYRTNPPAFRRRISMESPAAISLRSNVEFLTRSCFIYILNWAKIDFTSIVSILIHLDTWIVMFSDCALHTVITRYCNLIGF